ncbi:DNA repair protein RecN [Paracoccus aurantiacus]|uniref:DNA repair protein RecN n=1 Tax=Paracoccus aurantiacus TaxID=2599412 RepID=A0A5C6SA65_9RHOB|nr:DNA repair protein RecN [Paracoccus aurantiacus]TXB71274.1 DNA repair protein RecN [Paracoccus aurantiacus]
MLRELHIRDILLIDRLKLDFGPGLNVLTGETGAGKSILLDCLGFVLGWRGRAELVRSGAAQGEVVAVFDLPDGHPAHAILEEAGIEAGAELILRRVNSADGRKSAWINDRRASGEVLRTLSETLVELHGQHDDRGLLNPRGHRQLLDAFAGTDLAPIRNQWRELRAVEAQIAALEASQEAQRKEAEFLSHALEELAQLDPQPGEDATLDTRRRAMQGAERIRDDVARALAALGPGGAEGAMLDATRWLEGAADQAEGRFDAPLEALSRALVELGEAFGGVEAAIEAMDFDPSELERTEERLFGLRALARKHDVQPDDLADLAENLQSRWKEVSGSEELLVELRQRQTQHRANYETLAQAATALRSDAAAQLDTAMAAELAPLKMERAVFETRLEEGESGPEGRDNVFFTVATNPGAPAGALDKIASGGELSRFLLALKVSLARGNDAVTMIFDEIDRGVGGATADAVGRRLARLSESAQVLVVTHSPQVAALGSTHFRVAKDVDDGMTTSRVHALNQDERVDEIARMLSGETITPAARDAARVLIGIS